MSSTNDDYSNNRDEEHNSKINFGILGIVLSITILFCCLLYYKYFYLCFKDIFTKKNRIHASNIIITRSEKEKCSICLEDMTNSDSLEETQKNFTLLKCNHMFHQNCLNSWLDFNNTQNENDLGTCPICRTNVQIEKISTIVDISQI
ncbi:Ring finger domain [seawater metagenome]|uniref:Ring finger domain n=1 Tax=seawater metagenome TaxID=1561972 RepID=A0A5E8CJA2_9ZZZZ